MRDSYTAIATLNYMTQKASSCLTSDRAGYNKQHIPLVKLFDTSNALVDTNHACQLEIMCQVISSLCGFGQIHISLLGFVASS